VLLDVRLPQQERTLARALAVLTGDRLLRQLGRLEHQLCERRISKRDVGCAQENEKQDQREHSQR
jgi:hypothetical protein